MGTDKFGFTDKEFIKVLNIICEMDMGPGEEYTPITSIDEDLHIERYDSMGMMMFFIWISELFGIAEPKIEKFITKGIFTLRAVKDFVNAEATRTYTYAEAEEFSKRMF
jgi:hypothetical protein